MGKSNQTFTVMFFVKKNWRNDNGHGHVYQRITINGEQAAFSINRIVPLTSWDVRKGLIKPKFKETEEVNSFIEVMRNKAYNAYIKLFESNKTITPQAGIDDVLGKTERKHSLISFFEKHNKMMQSSIGAGATYGNYKNFKTSLKYLKEFVQTRHHYAVRRGVQVVARHIEQELVRKQVQHLNRFELAKNMAGRW